MKKELKLPIEILHQELEPLEQVEQEGVILETPLEFKSTQDIQTKKFCLTLNNYSEQEFLDLQIYCQKYCNKYVIGKEVGENNTPHLQIALHTKVKTRFSAIKTIIGNRYHIEKQKSKNDELSFNYCMKDGNFIGTEEAPYQGQDLILQKEFYPWQSSAVDIANTKNDRTINWIFEEKGNTGKSKWCKYMIYHHNAIVITKGKYADIMNYVYNCKNTKLIIIDLSRSMGNHVSYAAIEDLKNGIIVNTKYETGQKLIIPPTIIILSNKYPETENLSLDRWAVFEIVNRNLVKQNIKLDTHDQDPGA